MARRFSPELLYRLRNEIAMERLITTHLEWPSKRCEGRFYFLCPRCGEFRTGVNPRMNLGRCFLCAENFNHIDFVVLTRECDFVEAVQFLASLLSTPVVPTTPEA